MNLYSSELLSDDNQETIDNICEYYGIAMGGATSIKYVVKNNLINTLKSEGKFHFPVD